jgi:hypothetical protein
MRMNCSRIAFWNEAKTIDLLDAIEPWYYRVVPLLMMNLLDEPAMLALAFC